jgi:hypothetical protein
LNLSRLNRLGILARLLAGLAFGALAGSMIWHSGLGVMFLIALSLGAALLSLGLGPARLLMGAAIWLGQYAAFYLRFELGHLPAEIAALQFLTRSLFVFVPAIAVVAGGYAGLLVERIYRTCDARSPR